MLLAMLPTNEDFRRGAVEPEPAPVVAPKVAQNIYASDGKDLGKLYPWSGRYEGLCPCESGSEFALCHGAA